jgi:hypothetical protein
LLLVTVPYLIPNSQDTSAFYLGNIYQVLADPNATRTPISLPFAEPPPFSPPSYAISVNSLWFLSLVINLICALAATSLQEFAYEYISVTRPLRCSPEKRARKRASHADRTHMFIIINNFRTLLHLSVFLFFAGLAILLFHINHTVFKSVIWLIALFSYYYAGAKLALFWHTDTSIPDWKIDAEILGWTINALGDDNEMEHFFDAIPGFFKSKRVKDLGSRLPDTVVENFWKAANGFFERTLSSESLTEHVKSRRLDIGMNALSAIPIADASSIQGILFHPWDQEPQNIEMGHTMARWCTSENSHIAQYARCIATRILAGVRERNDRWIELAIGVLGISVDDLRTYIAHGDDSLSLAILISVARRDIHSDFYDRGLPSTLYRLNILNTSPELQHDFCMLWNDCVEEAKRQPPDTSRVTSRRGRSRITSLLFVLDSLSSFATYLRALDKLYPLAPFFVATTTPMECCKQFPVEFLRLTRSIYIRLHQGTHFSASTPPQSYPCATFKIIAQNRPSPIPMLFPFPPNLVIRPMPHLTIPPMAVATLYDWPRC